MLRISVCLALLLSFVPTSNTFSQRSCGHDELHNERMQDPEYRDFLKQLDKEVKRLISENRSTPQMPVLTFPVAIHYNWSGIPPVVTQCMIDAAENSINALNDDYLGQNADLSDYDALTDTCSTYYPQSAKSTTSNIQFCIAKYDHPNCSDLCDNELAITAGQYSYPNTGGCFGDYINIFVEANTGQLGIAPVSGVTILGGNGPQIDVSTWGGPGFMDSNCPTFNTSNQYNLGRTLTHEMGHYFGLKHVFVGDCESTTNNANDDDGYADTPDQSVSNGGKPVVLNCDPSDNANTANNSCGTLDMWCSYMDYCDDSHLFMFTAEQSAKIYADGQLSPIADADIKCNGSALPPTAMIGLPDELLNFCTNDAMPYTVVFEDNSSRCATSWSWTFSGAGVSPTSSNLENPSVTVSSTGTLTITLQATNAAGTSPVVTESMYVNVAPNGSCPDCGPDFVDSGGPSSPYQANETNIWTFCAGPNEILEIDLTSIDLPGGLFSDVVYIYDGDMLPANLTDYEAIMSENNGSNGGFWLLNNSGTVSFSGTTYESPSQCVTMRFTSDSSTQGNGWEATITCKDAPSCMDGIQNQDETFVDCGGTACNPCPSACGFTFTDKGGIDNNYSNDDSGTQWLLCADNPDEILNLDFSVFQNGGAALLIFNGDITIDNSNINNSDFNMQQGGYFPNGSSYTTENPITSSGQCFTFYFTVFNSSVTPTAGFQALVNCCAPDELTGCTNSNATGSPFTEMVDNYCTDVTLTDITSLKPSDLEDDARSCAALSDNQTFYQITCDSDGGTLNVDVSANSEGGSVDAALYGPVSGTCPNYTGANQVACESSNDPAALSINANANEVYLLVVASENRGAFSIDGSGSALASALPVSLISYEALINESTVDLRWEVASEINHSHYTIFKSRDGIDYTKLIQISDAKTDGNSMSYLHQDDSPEDGKNYYKLMQTDIDGSTTKLGVRVVNYEVRKKEVNFYPNPVDGEVLTLTGLDKQSDYSIKITSAQGISTSITVPSIDNNTTTLDIGNLTAGVYFLTIVREGQKEVYKFVKL